MVRMAGDPDALAEKILAAMDQREKLPDIGRASRRSAEKRADWKKNSEVLMNTYRSIIEGN
jgi:glycosyltransferase involved in cell wall biosynthesis